MKRITILIFSLLALNMGISQTAVEIRPDTLGIGVFYGSISDLQDELAVVGTGPGLIFPPIGPYVYLYHEKNGQWELAANLVALDSTDTFFTDVALTKSPGTAYIMAGDMDDDQEGNRAGASYIFTYDISGGTWTQQAKLTGGVYAENTSSLGASVAIDGDFALAGAPKRDLTNSLPNPDDGAAVIYERDAGTDSWVIDTQLIANDFRPGANFGQGVGISGNYAIIGSPFADSVGQGVSLGAAYIFENKVDGWEQIQKLVPSSRSGLPIGTDNFGWSVDIEGDYAIVGAWSYVVNSSNPTGMAAIFERQGNNWVETAFLIPSDSIASGAFGWDVSISSDGVAAVGAHSSTEGISAYVYKKQGNDWIEQSSKININNGGVASVAVDGDRLLVGATDANTGGNTFIYTGICTGGVNVEPIRAAKNHFQFYPNPAANSVHLEGITNEAQVDLYSLDGKRVMRQKVHYLSPLLDLTELQGGRYILQVKEGNHHDSFQLNLMPK